MRKMGMRKLALAAAAAVALLALPGCVSTIEGIFDEHARDECDRETRGTARTDCYDSVDRNRRERDQD